MVRRLLRSREFRLGAASGAVGLLAWLGGVPMLPLRPAPPPPVPKPGVLVLRSAIVLHLEAVPALPQVIPYRDFPTGTRKGIGDPLGPSDEPPR